MGAQIFSRSDEQGRQQDEFNTSNSGDILLGNLNGKAIISAADGNKIGNVQDILVDPEALRVAGFMITSGGIFDRDAAFVSASDVQAWGKDAILIDQPEVIRTRKDMPGRETWVNLGDQLKGRPIVTSTGEKLGNVDDVLIDAEGRVVAYTVSDNPFGQRRRVEANGTRTLGGDVIIIDR